ncbi:MAG: XdhC family protein [Planctomycetota bacterium]
MNQHDTTATPASRTHPLLDVLRGVPAFSAPDVAERCALCVVTSVRGSTPQVPGAALLVRSDRDFIGTVGGGFVESNVLDDGVATIRSGRGAVKTYDLTHVRGETMGAVCGGFMDIAHVPIAFIDDASKRIQQFCAAQSSNAGAALTLPIEDEEQRALRIRIKPAPTLIVVGAGHCGRALAELCATLDFRVIVMDDRDEFLDAEAWPSGVTLLAGDPAVHLAASDLNDSTCIAVVTRGHQQDYEALRAVVGGDAGYVGLIGSRRKSSMIFKDLRATGVKDEHLDAVRTPIGLDIGAQTVREIAVSIAAELIQHRRQAADIEVDLISSLTDEPLLANNAS